MNAKSKRELLRGINASEYVKHTETLASSLLLSRFKRYFLFLAAILRKVCILFVLFESLHVSVVHFIEFKCVNTQQNTLVLKRIYFRLEKMRCNIDKTSCMAVICVGKCGLLFFNLETAFCNFSVSVIRENRRYKWRHKLKWRDVEAILFVS